MAITFAQTYLAPFLSAQELAEKQAQLMAAHQALHEKTGAGSEFLGWLDLPVHYNQAEFARIKQAAAKIIADSEVLIVIGIGGSYLGARAAIEFLHSPLYNNKKKTTPDVYFAGSSISPFQLSELLHLCEGREVSVNVISKSGTTTEPALAFRVLRRFMEEKYGRQGAAERIYVTTDESKGKLRELAEKEGYERFVIPDDIGGRFSVLTAVGLLPIAVSGADIDTLMQGARDAREEYSQTPVLDNPCYRYAACRNILYERGLRVELFASFEPRFALFAEWLKQLFGESEGKEHKGIFPASALFSTDLHSLGQYIQDGSRILFETIVSFEDTGAKLTIEPDPADGDGLNFLAGQDMNTVNRKAMQGTCLAHVQGGTPVMVLTVPDMREHSLGGMIYFFEKACAISGYMLGVNPFDQPGVEDYKRNMFALLGKPGYEDLKKELEERL